MMRLERERRPAGESEGGEPDRLGKLESENDSSPAGIALSPSYVALLPCEDGRSTPTPPKPARIVDRALTDLKRLLIDLRDDIEHGKWKATRYLDIELDATAHDAVVDTFENFERDLGERLSYVLRLLETLSGRRPYVAGIEVGR